MTSPAEMANVGIAVATTSILLASADEKDAVRIVDLLAGAASARLDMEQRQSAGLIRAASDRAAAIADEQWGRASARAHLRHFQDGAHRGKTRISE